MIEKIVTGGQSGVDRAAISRAVRIGIPVGGGCPKGRWAEDGEIPITVPLVEVPRRDPDQRAERNLRASDVTLIPRLEGSTRRPANFAVDWNRPCSMAAWQNPRGIGESGKFLKKNRTRVLSVAGPREFENPGIGRWAIKNLLEILSEGMRHTNNTTEGIHDGDADDRGNHEAANRGIG